MSTATTGHGTASEPWPPRCEECQAIKRRRARALEIGDRRTAAQLTTAMGVHLRKAH